MITTTRYHLAIAFVAALAAANTAEANQSDAEQVKANFQSADANNDQKLDADEFKAFIDLNAEHDIGKSSTVKRFGAYDKAFSKADQNSDGFVTAEELKANQEQ